MRNAEWPYHYIAGFEFFALFKDYLPFIWHHIFYMLPGIYIGIYICIFTFFAYCFKTFYVIGMFVRNKNAVQRGRASACLFQPFEYLFAAYAKYVMADALACIIGFTFLGLIVGIGIPVMLIRFRSNAEKNGTIKTWDYETRGLNSGLRIVFMLVGAWIICASIVMNLGTIIAPEGAVVADILGKSR